MLGGQRVTRIEPAGPVQAYQTYALITPRGDTHWRTATCAEVECQAYASGWTTVIDPATELGRKQLAYIRNHSGRAYYDTTSLDTTLVELRFPPGQQCFATHRVRVGREPLYVVRGGDWRSNLGGIRRHTRAEHWVEDFAEHQDKIHTIHERG